MVGKVNLTGVQDITPGEAPVSDPEPLTGKEKAGVQLTWGIIGVTTFILTVILGIFLWGEGRYSSAFDLVSQLQDGSRDVAEIENLMATLDANQKSFRTFWYDILQLVLLNVLFPTLTALLGYVFGTSRNNNSASDEES